MMIINIMQMETKQLRYAAKIWIQLEQGKLTS